MRCSFHPSDPLHTRSFDGTSERLRGRWICPLVIPCTRSPILLRIVHSREPKISHAILSFFHSLPCLPCLPCISLKILFHFCYPEIPKFPSSKTFASLCCTWFLSCKVSQPRFSPVRSPRASASRLFQQSGQVRLPAVERLGGSTLARKPGTRTYNTGTDTHGPPWERQVPALSNTVHYFLLS